MSTLLASDNEYYVIKRYNISLGFFQNYRPRRPVPRYSSSSSISWWRAQTQRSLESNHYLLRYHEGGSKKTFDLVMCNLANQCKLEEHEQRKEVSRGFGYVQLNE